MKDGDISSHTTPTALQDVLKQTRDNRTYPAQSEFEPTGIRTYVGYTKNINKSGNYRGKNAHRPR